MAFFQAAGHRRHHRSCSARAKRWRCGCSWSASSTCRCASGGRCARCARWSTGPRPRSCRCAWPALAPDRKADGDRRRRAHEAAAAGWPARPAHARHSRERIEIKALRELHLRPHTDAFFAWVEAEYENVRDQRGLLRTALGYAHRQRGPLTRFYDDGRLRLDNNRSERELRRVATWGSLCVTPSVPGKRSVRSPGETRRGPRPRRSRARSAS